MVQVFNRLPLASEYANKAVWLPVSTALPRDINREQPGLWVSDGVKWTRVVFLGENNTVTLPPTVPPVLPPGITVTITHAHKYRLFSGEQVEVPDWHQYILADTIIVDTGASVVTEPHGILAIV